MHSNILLCIPTCINIMESKLKLKAFGKPAKSRNWAIGYLRFQTWFMHCGCSNAPYELTEHPRICFRVFSNVQDLHYKHGTAPPHPLLDLVLVLKAFHHLSESDELLVSGRQCTSSCFVLTHIAYTYL